jgi:hypothetical protein
VHGFTSEQIKAAVEEGYAWLGGLAELRDVTCVDLPTSHWPMWSRPSGDSPGSSATLRRLTTRRLTAPVHLVPDHAYWPVEVSNVDVTRASALFV